MKKTLLYILACLFCACSPKPYEPTLDAKKFLQEDRDIPEVLLVGSFHFAYYGLDAHVTTDDDKVNVLSPQRQKEMKELVEYINQFKPNKIAVEGGRNSGYIIRRYEDYIENPSGLQANEIDQLAFPIMKENKLDTLYGTNAVGVSYDLANHQDSLVIHPILEDIFTDYDFNSEEEISKRYKAWYTERDKSMKDLTMLEIFQDMNSDDYLSYGYGAYLVGDFKNGAYDGADALAMYWYSRNLRIFRNIQNITEPGDRVLVIYGAGHIEILQQLFESSPEYDVVKFNQLNQYKIK